MATKDSDIGQRAWRILRLALLWARKGGVFRRRLIELRLVPKLLKSLAHPSSSTNTKSRTNLFYGERQLSFDNTPIFRLKMHRPPSLRFNLPCITPQVDFDQPAADGHRFSFLKYREEEQEEQEIEEDFRNEYEICEENEIDSRAEEFIANFYAQMKLQRQISFLQHNNDMLNTATT